MYRYLDQRLCDMNDAVKFAVWCVRTWSFAVARRQCPRRQLLTSAAEPRAESAYRTLDLFMGIFMAGARRRIEIRIPPCGRISEDEALLLAALSAIEGGDPAPARAVFADMLEPTAARHALLVAASLVDKLASAGHHLADAPGAGKAPPR